MKYAILLLCSLSFCFCLSGCKVESKMDKLKQERKLDRDRRARELGIDTRPLSEERPY